MPHRETRDVKPGDLLVAIPPGRKVDPFYRTVILVCVHDPEGSVGVVINRPTQQRLGSVIEPGLDQHEISFGGPVEQDCMLFLHRYGDQIQRSLQVMGDLFFCGKYEDMIGIARDEPNALHADSFFSRLLRMGTRSIGIRTSQGELVSDPWDRGSDFPIRCQKLVALSSA